MSYTTKSWDETMRDVRACMDKYPGLTDWRVERLVQGRKRVYIERTDADGVFKSDATNPPYNFVQVTLFYALRDHQPQAMTCTKHPSARENLRVIYLCIEALRLIAVRGLDDLVRTHYAQLPPPVRADDPYAVLGVRHDTPLDDIEQEYRAKIKRYHEAGYDPNPEKLRDLTVAMAAIRKERDA